MRECLTFLDGGAGTDILEGGDGADIYWIGKVGDHVAAEFFDRGSSGIDVVRVASSEGGTVRLFAGDIGIERISLLDTSALSIDVSAVLNAMQIYGNSFANQLTGTDFADRIDGGDGADILTGGPGGDMLSGGDGLDTAVYSGLFRSYAVNVTGANGSVLSANGSVSGGREGADTLSSIEVIQFRDGKLVFDASGVAAQVTRLYDTVLQRAPDQAGLDMWVDQLEDRGGALKDVANGFLNSAEFQAKTGRLSNADYVEFLYVNALGRASDPGGKANWIERLDNKSYDRADLLIGFSESLEHKNATAALVAKGFFDTHDAYQTVALLYDSFAGRLPDASGLVHWAEALESGAMTLSQVAAGFANSAEFQGLIKGMSHSDLVEFMYQNTLNRASDAVGKESWVKMLDAGLSDTDLLIGFSQSGEHFHLIGTHITNGIDYF